MYDEKLRACPFCGGDPNLNSYGISPVFNREDAIIVCHCDDMIVQTSCIFKDDAIKAWNTRPIEDALRARIADQEEALKQADDILMLWECEGTMDEGARDLQEIIHKGLKP